LGYLTKKKYGDIQRELQGYEAAQLMGYGIFQEKLKGYGIPRPPSGASTLEKER